MSRNCQWIILSFAMIVFDGRIGWGQTRCEVVPQADRQVAFSVDGVEKVRWHFGDNYPRPYFFPLRGPSGAMLTRMGHPGAPDHDHHQSIWFAHNKLNELDFWANGKGTQVRQKRWLCYREGADEAVMAVLLGWYDVQGKEVMEQELIVALLPISAESPNQLEEHGLELQSTFRPPVNVDEIELGQTNFGFLAVRVAKGISAHFGGGQLSNSEGGHGEQGCFGKQARWMDYSGTVVSGSGADRKELVEGITFFDHPDNPRYPTHWHVRQDGWMGAAFGLAQNATITRAQPLTLRYFLHAHSGHYDSSRSLLVANQFAHRPRFELVDKPQPHLQYGVHRKDNAM